jgi:hypothetical protein
MNLINWIRRAVFEEHKPVNDEHAKIKNIRTQSPMHECHFSLNRKYINAYFSLNEEQQHP